MTDTTEPAVDVQIVQSTDPRCAELEQAGYRVVGESWGARLRFADPRDRSVPGLAVLERAAVRPSNDGIVVQELDVSFAAAVRELEAATNADYPDTPATAHELLDLDGTVALWASGTRIFGALDGSRVVAVTAIDRDGTSAELEFASVLGAYRARGIGAAVAATAILSLLSDGVREFRTGGAAMNAASLGTVRSLGFAVEEQWRSYQRGQVLSPAEGLSA